MKEFEATGNYYTISHIALATGLTDRTLRSYIAMGILEGEKINGLWHFSDEQVEAFLRHPKVRPSVQAKKNGIVYDFLAENKHREEECCMILDLPAADPKATAEFFCYAISNDGYTNIRFSFDSVSCTPRVILQGRTEDVLQLVQDYRRTFPAQQ